MRKLNILATILYVCCAAYSESPDAIALPDLGAIIQNEVAAVDTVRLFYVEQLPLVHEAIRLSKRHSKAGDKELAEAKMEEAKQRMELVRGAYLEILKHYPENARTCNYLGELLYDSFGASTKAIELWKLAMKYDDKLSAPMNNLAIHYGHIGAYGESLKLFGKALELEPDNPDYLFNLVQFYMLHYDVLEREFKVSRKKLYKEAIKMSRRAIKNSPDDFSLRKDYAMNFFAAVNFGVKANWRTAAKAWRDAREIAPNETESFGTWLNEARVWIKQPSYSKAEKCIEEALKIHPDSDAAKRLLEKVKNKSQ